MYYLDVKYNSRFVSYVGVLSRPEWDRKQAEYKASIDLTALEPKRSFFNCRTKDPL